MPVNSDSNSDMLIHFSSRMQRSLLVAGLALALAACGGGGGDDDADDGADGGDDVDASPGDDDGGSTPDAMVIEQVPLIEGLATLAGVNIPGLQDGDRNTALFNNPVNVVVAPDGNLIVADFDNSLIRRVTPAGDVTTLNTEPAAGVFRRPFGLFVSGDSLYIQTDGNSLGQTSEMGGAALWRMALAGGPPELARDLPGRCRGMAEMPDGRVAMAFYQQHVVQIWDPTNNTLTENFAGMFGMAGMIDAQSVNARFSEPYDVLALEDGSLLVTDFANHRLRQIDIAGNVTTFAGTGSPGSADGALLSATFNFPQGLAVDAVGNIYVTDTGGYVIRRISPDGQVTTIAGNGTAGYLDSESPLSGQLYGIEGLDAGDDGYLYIADGTRGEDLPYHRLRRLTLE
jgi:DNA-binding beta-propeller fold protein YncE